MSQDYNQREILAFGIEILMFGNEDTGSRGCRAGNGLAEDRD
jgi:hypothetical protein